MVDIPIDVVFISQEGFVRFEDDIEYTPLISEKVQEAYKLSEITEEEASEIVDNYEYPMSRDILGYEDYNNKGFEMKDTALESLHSLLESQGIEITQNTYIFKA